MPNIVYPPLQILRGYWSLFAADVGTLADGEPCKVAIPLPDGTSYEVLFFGGHDNSNKVMGAGTQVLTAAVSPPTFQAPAGAFACDPQFNLWISTGFGWQNVLAPIYANPPQPLVIDGGVFT